MQPEPLPHTLTTPENERHHSHTRPGARISQPGFRLCTPFLRHLREPRQKPSKILLVSGYRKTLYKHSRSFCSPAAWPLQLHYFATIVGGA